MSRRASPGLGSESVNVTGLHLLLEVRTMHRLMCEARSEAEVVGDRPCGSQKSSRRYLAPV